MEINSSKHNLAIKTQVQLCLDIVGISIRNKVALQFIEWLQQPLLDASTDGYTEVLISIKSSFNQIACYVGGEINLFIDRAFDFLFESGASESEVELFTQTGQRLKPELIGTWLQIDQNTLDGGWYCPQDISLPLVWDCIPSSSDKNTFIDWANKKEILDCNFLRHSIGQLTPMTELFIKLPVGSLQAQLTLTQSAFEALDIPWFTEEIVACFSDFNAETIGLVAAFTTDGVIRLGIYTPKPSIDLILVLSTVAQGFSDEKLATLEGTLNVEGAQTLALYRDGSGLGFELYYAL